MLQLAVTVLVALTMERVVEVSLRVRRYLVVVVVTREGVTVVVGLSVVEGFVTVTGAKVDVAVSVVVAVTLTTGVDVNGTVTVGV